MKNIISILVTCHNSERFIKQTLDSCLDQLDTNYEIIIGDDCSSDNSWEIINQYNDSKITKYRHQVNIGEYENRNFLINKSNGQFFIFIDGEDLLYSHAITLLRNYTSLFPDAALFMGGDWDEKMILPKVLNPSKYFCLEFLNRGVAALNFTKILFNKRCVIESGMFDRPDIKIGDLYIQFKLATKYESVIIPDGFSWWRRRRHQASESILSSKISYFQEEMKFKPTFIYDSKKYLSETEYKQIIINYYGNILRETLKKMIILDTEAFVFFMKYKYLLKKYLYTILIRPSYNYLKDYSGEKNF